MSADTKRKCEESENSVAAMAKRINVCENGLGASEEHPLTGILILNDDCFRKIFKDLNFSELLNVIQAHDRFKFACEDVFKKSCGRLVLRVSNVVDTMDGNTNISACEMNYSIQMLKHFGHLVRSLYIRFKFGRIDTLLVAVAENCGDNLLELELDHEGDHIRKPWTTTASASIKRMKSFLKDLNIQFPKLRSLKLKYSISSAKCPYSNAIIQSYPSLTSLKLSETLAGRLFTEEKLMQFFALNRQLESFACTVDQWELFDTEDPWFITPAFISCLDETLLMLKCVEINRVSNGGLLTPETYPIRFKNLKKLRFHSFLEWDVNPNAGFMSFLSDSVEVLKLSIYSANIHYFLEDVTQFKKLKVLHLEYPMRLYSAKRDADAIELTVWGMHGLKVIMQNNPNLTEIRLTHHPQDRGTDTMDDIYKNISTINAEDGSRWTVDDELFEGYTFRKVLN